MVVSETEIKAEQRTSFLSKYGKRKSGGKREELRIISSGRLKKEDPGRPPHNPLEDKSLQNWPRFLFPFFGGLLRETTKQLFEGI